MTALIALAAATLLPLPPPMDLPRTTMALTAHGRTQRCEGVTLAALAQRAGLPTGKALRGPALTTVIVAQARDGYGVAFTLAEIDPDLGNRAVLVTDRCDGKPLADEDGPWRLVVPGEIRAARSVRQLGSLTVMVAGNGR